MFVDLLGVWDDGSNLAAPLLGNRMTDAYVVRGANITVRLEVRANDNTIVDVTGTTSYLYVRKSARYSQYVLKKAGEIKALAGPGRIDFSITPNDLKFVVQGRYLYDVWMTKDDKTNAVIPLSTFIIQPGLALPPYGAP